MFNLHISGIEASIELGCDWKGRDVWFVTLNGERKSFHSAWGAGTWLTEAVKRHRDQSVARCAA